MVWPVLDVISDDQSDTNNELRAVETSCALGAW